jgi:hypothetical protein
MIGAPLVTFLTTIMPTLADETFVIVTKDNTAHQQFAVYVLVPDDDEKATCLDMLKMFGYAFSVGFQGTLKDCKKWLSIADSQPQPDMPDVP